MEFIMVAFCPMEQGTCILWSISRTTTTTDIWMMVYFRNLALLVECKCSQTYQIWLWMTKCDIRFLQWIFKYVHMTIEMANSPNISNNNGVEFFTEHRSWPHLDMLLWWQNDIVIIPTSAIRVISEFGKSDLYKNGSHLFNIRFNNGTFNFDAMNQ